MLKMDDFWENGKAIALLFGEKLAFLDTIILTARLNMLKMDDLGKMASL